MDSETKRQWETELSTISEETRNESGSPHLVRHNTFPVKVCENWLETANTDILSPNKAAEVNTGSSLVKVPWGVTQHNSTWPSSSLTSKAQSLQQDPTPTTSALLITAFSVDCLSRLYRASEINLPGSNDFKGRFVGRSWHKTNLQRGFTRREGILKGDSWPSGPERTYIRRDHHRSMAEGEAHLMVPEIQKSYDMHGHRQAQWDLKNRKRSSPSGLNNKKKFWLFRFQGWWHNCQWEGGGP